MKKQLLLVPVLFFGLQVVAKNNDESCTSKKDQRNSKKHRCSDRGPIVGTVEATGEGATGIVKSAGEGATNIFRAIFPGLDKKSEQEVSE